MSSSVVFIQSHSQVMDLLPHCLWKMSLKQQKGWRNGGNCAVAPVESRFLMQSWMKLKGINSTRLPRSIGKEPSDFGWRMTRHHHGGDLLWDWMK